jgi:4'-phosphopantetheinyl transferase
MDGENTVLGELLLREMLQSLTGLSSISLGRGPFGKPFWREKPLIQVNISHSHDFVACAVAPAPVGIDVQVSNQASPALVRRFFAPEEARYVMEGDPDGQALRFCRIWTMKESYIKRDGRGLRIPLQSFDVLQLQQVQPKLFHEIPLAPRAICQICCDAPLIGHLLSLEAHEFLGNGLPLERDNGF